MIRRLRLWLTERYFPAAAKVEIAALRADIADLRAQNKQLNAYIDGLEQGVRLQRRITINNGVKQNEHLHSDNQCGQS